MANLKSLAKDTVIYGFTSIVGRFLNYLLVPLYTAKISAASGGYGVITNIYSYVALIIIILTFGMETTFFRFSNKEDEKPADVISTSLMAVGAVSLAFVALIFLCLPWLAPAMGYADHPSYISVMAIVVALDAIQSILYAYLRYLHRPIKFASLKLLFILLNILLNVIYFVWLEKTEVFYVFCINLWCTGLITFFFIPDFFKVKWQFDFALLKRMFSYSWPILVLAIAGVLNQTVDKIIFPWAYTYTGLHTMAEAKVQLGEYGACVKVAMIMAMITQAFRYAYEPIVFSKAKDKDSKEYYAVAMKYFIIFTLFAFLCVMGYMDILKHIIGAEYREGLVTVPIVMAAEIMMGIYFNLSFWYKLIDKTIWGAWFSLTGCAVLIAVNIIFIPKFGYMACAWGGFAGYGVAMLASYFVGQKYYPLNYPLKDIALYVWLTIMAFTVMVIVRGSQSLLVSLSVNTLFILLFVVVIIRRDLPMGKLPVIGKFFK